MPVMQLGVHGIDIIQSMLGRIVSVSAYADSFTTDPSVTDSLVAAVRFESGPMGTIVSNYCTQVAFDFRISGTEGSVFATPHRGWFRRAADTDSQCEGPVDAFDFLEHHTESFPLQMDAFARLISDGEPAGASTGDALSAVAVVEALEQSVASSASVTVQQVNDDGVIA